jgi:Methyltransferase domain
MNIHDVYRPFFAHFRSKRLRFLYDTLGITASTRVLDVGGTPYFWQLAESLNLPVPLVTMANLDSGIRGTDRIRAVVADGTRLPFRDKEFDVAFSNSVVEHLGSWEAQIRFANELRRVSVKYFVQTPDKRFPIEPHLITPFVHWLPRSWQLRCLRNFTIWGLMERPSHKRCQDFMDEIQLLDKRGTERLLPDAVVFSEKLFGVPKSVIAIRK